MTPKTCAKTIRIVAWGFIVISVVWGLAPYSSINAPARMFLDLLEWPFGDAPAQIQRSTMWLSAIGSGLSMALSIMLLGIVAPAIEQEDRRAIRVTIWAFVAWYLIDGSGSIAAGVASNAGFNTILLAGVLIPLLLVRFDSKADETLKN